MATALRTVDPVRAVLVAALVTIAGTAVGVALVIAVGAVARAVGLALSPLQRIGLSLLFVTGVGFGGTSLGYLRYRGLGLDYVGVAVPSVRDLLAVGLGYLLALGAAIGGALIVRLAGVDAGTNRGVELGVQNPEILLVLIPAAFLLIGPGEELLFRGVVQRRLREAFGPVSAIALASALFAAIHFLALSGGSGARFVTVGILFLPSLVFGAAYELTDNLVVPAAIHAAYDATLFGLLYLAVRFAPLQPAVESGAVPF